MGKQLITKMQVNRELDPLAGHAAALKALRRIMARVDMAEFEAQKHGVAMVQLLAGFAYDVTLDTAFRRTCAIDVLDRAYGTPTQKKQVTILDPDARTASGDTVAAEIDAIRVETERLEARDRLIAQKVPFEEWPEDVRVLPDSVVYAELLGADDQDS